MFRISQLMVARWLQRQIVPCHALATRYIFVEVQSACSCMSMPGASTTLTTQLISVVTRFVHSFYIYIYKKGDHTNTFMQFFIEGKVPALLATVGKNGKVSFLEKWGTSEFTNSTGA